MAPCKSYPNHPSTPNLHEGNIDNTSVTGIVRFVGEDKNRMQFIGHIAYSSSPERPTNFEGTEPFWWLTKKVKN